ncbi:FXYD domain-containing ion transport regulator 3 [Platysternon megacephalum]|uniref:FXYD domain-containing ion transport regulator 3 n=1 Tax=Platysternon megacephalum TaxID=55544 RepID=A0A4D9DST9_9SAUR|nr:FXYD domain-containing ion transport regulator 3 [Platysternon megacephalum]
MGLEPTLQDSLELDCDPYKTCAVPLYKRTMESPVLAGDFTPAALAGEHKPQSLAEAQSKLQLYLPGQAGGSQSRTTVEGKIHWPRRQYKFSLELRS